METKTIFVVTPANRYSIYVDYEGEYVSAMYAAPTGAPYGQEFVFYPYKDQTLDELVNEVCGSPDEWFAAGYASMEA